MFSHLYCHLRDFPKGARHLTVANDGHCSDGLRGAWRRVYTEYVVGRPFFLQLFFVYSFPTPLFETSK